VTRWRSGFWLSYAVLVLGLTHNWFGIPAAAAQATQELFLVSWLAGQLIKWGRGPGGSRPLA
jgi:hypothetical protein